MVMFLKCILWDYHLDVKKSLFLLILILSGFNQCPSFGSGLVDCLDVRPVYTSGFIASGAMFPVEITNKCYTNTGSLGLTEFTLQGSGARDVQSTYVLNGQELNFNTFDWQIGNYNLNLHIYVLKDGSASDFTLGSFYNSGHQNQIITKTTTNALLDCSFTTTKTIKRQCILYPNFQFTFCSTLQNGMLQMQKATSWIDLWKIEGKKDTSCQSKFPYLIKVEGSTKLESGTSIFRVKFGSEPLNWYQDFKLDIAVKK